MALIGSALLVVLTAVALLAAAAGVLAWSRVRGGRMLAACQRAGIVLLCQLTAVVAVGAAINDYGYFYTSWDNLGAAVTQSLGVNSGNGTSGADGPTRREDVHARSQSDGRNPASAGTVDRHRGDHSAPGSWARKGRLESVSVLGAITGLREHAFVYLPPQYFQPRYAATRFPAVEVLTGYPGDDIALLRRMRYPQALDRLERTGRARPMVLVMMRSAVTFPRDTECTDVPAGPQSLTYLAADVPAQIARAFRVQPTGWGSIGNSTGGYCAAKIAMTHPLNFGAAASLSGYYYALHDATTGSLWGGSRSMRHLNDLRWRMLHLPRPPISLLIATARTETGPDGYREAVAFSRVARAPTTASLLVERSGGHNFQTWVREIPLALAWLSQRIGGP